MATKVLLTVQDAAEALGFSRAYIYELMNRGQLESVKVGAARRIPVAALDEFVARLRQEKTA